MKIETSFKHCDRIIKINFSIYKYDIHNTFIEILLNNRYMIQHAYNFNVFYKFYLYNINSRIIYTYRLNFFKDRIYNIYIYKSIYNHYINVSKEYICNTYYTKSKRYLKKINKMRFYKNINYIVMHDLTKYFDTYFKYYKAF